jgi:hypothetical protein
MAENALIPYSEIEKMAAAISKSGLFLGIETPAQAIGLMLIAQARGIHPAQAVLEYNIINGKPAMKAEAMLAHFQQAGGIVEWVEMTDEKVTGKFSHASCPKPVTITWDIPRAKRAEVYRVQTSGGKTGMWVKYPRQLLRARVISEGIRACYPAVVEGVYSVEEVQDFDNKKFVPPQELGDGASDTAVNCDRVVDATVAGICGNTVGDMPADAPEEGGNLPFENDGTKLPFVLISEPQRKRMFAISDKAGKTEEQLKAIVKKYGFEHSRDITRDKYELICNEVEGKREPGQD